MAKFTFDGPNKRVHIDETAVVDGYIEFTPEELWTEWVDWWLTDDNSKYLPALRLTGGDDIGGGQAVGNYVFFRNDLGWRGVPQDYDGAVIVINGAFFGQDPTLPVMENRPGQETDLILNRSALVTTVATGSGVTEQDKIDIAALVRADLDIVNEGVQKASLLVPHTTDL